MPEIYDFLAAQPNTYPRDSRTEKPIFPTATYYPVSTCLIESYGDLKHRIEMLYAVVNTTNIAMIESDLPKKRLSKTLAKKLKQPSFHTCLEGRHLIQIGETPQGWTERPRVTDARVGVIILGYRVITSESPEMTVECPLGLAQAREELTRRNGSDHLIGYALPNPGYMVIADTELHDPEKPWNSTKFDTGVCNCKWPNGTTFHTESLLWKK